MRMLVALLLALAGLAVVPAPAPAAQDQVVHVTATGDSLVASAASAPPGTVVFAVSGPGSATLLRLEGDYTLERLYADFDRLSSGKPGPVRRIRRGATFYGGMPGGPDGARSLFATTLEPGGYQLADLANGQAVAFEVSAGRLSARREPETAGTVSYTPLGITMPRSLPRTGWMRVVNQGRQVSRMDVVRLKRGTTTKQVKAYFRSEGRRFRGRVSGPVASTLLLSPDQRYWWSYSLPAGPVAASSPWPRQKDGAPQAHHGMWGVTGIE